MGSRSTSTGGVGDKVSLVLTPIVASLGVPVAKMSGRGLGHTGGTIDKLESFSGFSTEISEEKFIDSVNTIGIAIAGQTANLAPADKKLYALRDVTATVDQMSLIASSIMSKKLASGADAIVLDVKTGNGAFMQKEEDAIALAKAMVDIGNRAGKQTVAVITDMDEPLGNAVGNALEIKEVIDALHGDGPEDLMEVVYALGTQMLLLAKRAEDEEIARNLITESIQERKALKKFAEFIENQGGNREEILHPDMLPKARYVIPVLAEEEGCIERILAQDIGIACMTLGGGRENKYDRPRCRDHFNEKDIGYSKKRRDLSTDPCKFQRKSSACIQSGKKCIPDRKRTGEKSSDGEVYYPRINNLFFPYSRL